MDPIDPSPRLLPEKTLLDEEGSILTVTNFLSPSECGAFIQRTEAVGYDEAPVTTPRGFVMRPDLRNNTRVMEDVPGLAALLWARMRPFAVGQVEGWRAGGLNERFRYYRYTPGQYFKSHADGCFRRSPREESLFTAMVYLNEGFEGGSTDFFEGPRVVPRQGMLLLFRHELVHQGASVVRGCKYVLRTDVMYHA